VDCVSTYLPRWVDDWLRELMAQVPAIMITGPRACGKTTSAARAVRSVVRLDVPETAAAFRLAPDAALAAQLEPVLIDEWQEVPEVLAAVKRAVDADPRPGRFVLTGSVRAALSASTWPATGRVVPLAMSGITVAEEHRVGQDLLSQLAEPGRLAAATRVHAQPWTVPDYLDRALAGMYPELQTGSARRRQIWMDAYVDQLVLRDAPAVGAIRAPQRLRALLRAAALNTAGTPAETSLAQAAGLDVRTARTYLDLLEDLGVIHRLPAWHSNRFTRLTKGPKLHLVDPALAAPAAGVTPEVAFRSGDLIGRLVETFVVSQLRPLIGEPTSGVALSHLRERTDGREIDLIIERRDGTLIAIEVKASAQPTQADARHLAWLRDHIGSDFAAGWVLHTGSVDMPLGDRLRAAPISTLWADPAGHPAAPSR
jgi:predicted AAA+ superfamily ATPase